MDKATPPVWSMDRIVVFTSSFLWQKPMHLARLAYHSTQIIWFDYRCLSAVLGSMLIISPILIPSIRHGRGKLWPRSASNLSMPSASSHSSVIKLTSSLRKSASLCFSCAVFHASESWPLVGLRSVGLLTNVALAKRRSGIGVVAARSGKNALLMLNFTDMRYKWTPSSCVSVTTFVTTAGCNSGTLLPITARETLTLNDARVRDDPGLLNWPRFWDNYILHVM